MTDQAFAAARVFKEHFPEANPRTAIILGSGLGPLVDHLDNPRSLSYDALPGFHRPTVEGHHGQLLVGELQGQTVLCFKGRAHLYEGASHQNIQTLVRTAKLLGCERLIITNAAGSLNSDIGPGRLVLIKDHINFQSTNPLVGPNDDRFGPRFVSMENVYDADLRQKAQDLAKELGIELPQGVYFSVLGPSFETLAEIRAFKLLGADLVGMSTVPEVIVARHCGLPVLAISVVTNLAAGMHPVNVTHEETLKGAQLGCHQLTELVKHFVGRYPV